MAQHDQAQIWSDFRVGIITFIGIVLLVLGITFAGGDKGLLFKKTSVIKARLADVGGLKTGGSVTMNGMVIGKVTNITFVDIHDNGVVPEGGGEAVARDSNVVVPEGDGKKVVEAQDKNKIEVTMEIRSDLRNRIKTDSVPAVRTQGMLGDRYIDLPSGSEKAEVLPDGKVLTGASASDFDKTLKQAIEVMSESQKMLKAINEEQGSAGKLVYDQKFYNNLTAITDQLNDLIKDFKKHPRRYIKFSLF